jgi:hypothetical protein
MIGQTYLERGKPVVVLIRWSGKGPRNVLIQREDGSKVVRPFRGLRKPAVWFVPVAYASELDQLTMLLQPKPDRRRNHGPGL